MKEWKPQKRKQKQTNKKKDQVYPGLFFDLSCLSVWHLVSDWHVVSKTRYAHLPMSQNWDMTCASVFARRNAFGIGHFVACFFWRIRISVIRISVFTQNHLYGLSQRPGCPRGGLLSENALHGRTWWFLHSHGRSPNPFSTRVHPNPIHRGQAPYTPKIIFHRPTAYAASIPERGFFRCWRKRMARLEETCVNAHHIFFLTNGRRLGVRKLWHFTFFSVWLNTCGDDKIFMTSWWKTVSTCRRLCMQNRW